MYHATPRISDGAESLRHVYVVMNDEELILSSVWEMVERGTLDHGIKVYPGFYPYTVAAVRLAVGSDAPVETHVRAVRWLSCAVTLLALWSAAALLFVLTGSAWLGAGFAALWSVHPETVLWAARVHPDGFLMLFNNAALLCLAISARRAEDGAPPGVAERRWLLAATALAGLSAGTKIVGGFVMVCIVGWLVWRLRFDRRALLRTLGAHVALFLGVLVLTNPLLLSVPRQVVEGWIIQKKRNEHGPGASGLEWLTAATGARWFGHVGTLLALLGLGSVAHKEVRRAIGLPLAFALFFYAYLMARVSLVLPRYGAPSIWAFTLVGLVGLYVLLQRFAPRAWMKAGVAVALAVLFLGVDLPRVRAEIAADATSYQTFWTAERDALTASLETLDGEVRVVATEPNVFVPERFKMEVIWQFEGLALGPRFQALVIGPMTRASTSAKWREDLASGALGYRLHQRVGEFEVYRWGVER